MLRLASLLGGVAFTLCASAPAQTGPFLFDEVGPELGVVGNGPTFGGGAWGDWNNDGLLDLWVGNHANLPQFFVQQPDGTFEDKIAEVWAGNPFADTHGAVWADVDADGDLDLFELVGASSGVAASNQLWLNHDGRLEFVQGALGLDFPSGRGRMPIFVDWNGDQYLDLLAVNLYRSGQSATVPFLQVPNPNGLPSFQLDLGSSGFAPPPLATEFAHLADLTGDDSLELIIDGAPYPSAIYDLSDRPMVDLLSFGNLNGSTSVADVAFADFNGDGKTDVYLCRDRLENESEATLVSDEELRARLFAARGVVGFKFRATGRVKLRFPEETDLRILHLGEWDRQPDGPEFALDPRDASHHGMPAFTPGVDRGVYMGYERTTKLWTIVLSTPGRSQVGFFADGRELRDVNPVGGVSAEELVDRLLIKKGDGFNFGTVDRPVSGRAVVPGDFDNDMDVDLYVVRSGTAVNQKNIFLENQGDGTFVRIDHGGAGDEFEGAGGTLNGIGDGVAMADFNSDGWLDLFITNGQGDRFFTESANHQLFQNRGVELHPKRRGLMVELIGPPGNRDAIGAVVYLSVAGVEMKREQNGGMHRLTQNESRLHFGLGENSKIDGVRVVWPDGTQTTLGKREVGSVLTIRY